MLGFKDDKTLGLNVGLVLDAKDKSSDGIMLTDGKSESTFGAYDANSDWIVLTDRS